MDENLTEKKTFIPTYVNRFRIVGCLDPGSDVTLMQLSLFHKIFRCENALDKENVPDVRSYSNDCISIVGTVKCIIRLDSSHVLGLEVLVYVIQDIPNQVPWLLGANALRAGLGGVHFEKSPIGPYPVVTFTKPYEYTCTAYHSAPRELLLVTAHCNLGPNESEDVVFNLSPAAPVVRNDFILITSKQWGDLLISPSRSDVEFCKETGHYVATGRVTNICGEPIKGTVTGKFEIINNYKPLPLQNYDKAEFSALMKTIHLVGRLLLI